MSYFEERVWQCDGLQLDDEFTHPDHPGRTFLLDNLDYYDRTFEIECYERSKPVVHLSEITQYMTATEIAANGFVPVHENSLRRTNGDGFEKYDVQLNDRLINPKYPGYVCVIRHFNCADDTFEIAFYHDGVPNYELTQYKTAEEIRVAGFSLSG